MESIKKDIYEFISNRNIMSLSTIEGDKPWSCTVYYGLDDDFNFYLVTDPDSRHAKNITKNPNVSFTIFDSTTKITDSKFGIQAQGICEILSNFIDSSKGLLLWYKFNPGAEKKVTLEDLKKFKDTKVFRIKSKYLKYFAKDLYGDQAYGVLEL